MEFEKCTYCLQPVIGRKYYCYHAPLIFADPKGDGSEHGTPCHFGSEACLKEFCLDLSGFYDREINVLSFSTNIHRTNQPHLPVQQEVLNAQNSKSKEELNEHN